MSHLDGRGIPDPVCVVVLDARVSLLNGSAFGERRPEPFGLPRLLFPRQGNIPHQGNHDPCIRAGQDLPGAVHPVFEVLRRVQVSKRVYQRLGDALEESCHELPGWQPVLRVGGHSRHHCGGVHAGQHVSYAGGLVLGYPDIIILDGGHRGFQQDGPGRPRFQAGENCHIVVQSVRVIDQHRHVQAVRCPLNLDAGALVGIEVVQQVPPEGFPVDVNFQMSEGRGRRRCRGDSCRPGGSGLGWYDPRRRWGGNRYRCGGRRRSRADGDGCRRGFRRRRFGLSPPYVLRRAFPPAPQ